MVIDGEQITLNIGKLLSLDTAEEEETISSLKSRLKLMPNEVLKRYVKEIGSKLSRERKQNDLILKQSLDESPRRRNYVFLIMSRCHLSQHLMVNLMSLCFEFCLNRSC